MDTERFPEAILSARDFERDGSAHLTAELAAIEDCSVYDVWKAALHQDEKVAEHFGPIEHLINDATGLFGCISLRRIDDFLRHKKHKPSDMNWSDSGIDRAFYPNSNTFLLEKLSPI